VEVGRWVQPPSTNTRIRIIKANAPSFRFYVPPYVVGSAIVGSAVVDPSLVDSDVVDRALADSAFVDSAVVSSGVVDSAVVDPSLIDFALADSALVDSAFADSAVVGSGVVDSVVVDAPVVGAAETVMRFTPDFSVVHTHGIAAYGAFDAFCSAFHACTFFVRGCNGSCCCSLCLLLNSDACWSWRKAKFGGEEKCYRGLTVEHPVMVAECMEGVIGRIVEEGKKKEVGREEKVGGEEGKDAFEGEEEEEEGKRVQEEKKVEDGKRVDGNRVQRKRVEEEGTQAVGEENGEDDEEEMGYRSGFRAGARRTQPPADGIHTRVTPSSGLSAGFILASPPSLPAGSTDAHNLQESNSINFTSGDQQRYSARGHDDQHQASEDEMEQAFGHNLGFPTARRPMEYRRDLNCGVEPAAVMEDWLKTSGITIGSGLDQRQKEKAMQLLWTWKDIFCDDLATPPATDLIYHRIPTRRDCQPVRSKPRLSTAEEVAWLRENIPAMDKAGIIDRVDSPWSAPSRFVRKKNNSLRLTHTFGPINDATIKSNYPMRRVEPILNNLMQPRFWMFWWAAASNGYWAVPVWPPHVFKTAFSCALGQCAYKRMGQGSTGAPMRT
jgi:hypothetical protein